MKDGWKNKTMWTFIGGAATALAGSKFLKSDPIIAFSDS